MKRSSSITVWRRKLGSDCAEPHSLTLVLSKWETSWKILSGKEIWSNKHFNMTSVAAQWACRTARITSGDNPLLAFRWGVHFLDQHSGSRDRKQQQEIKNYLGNRIIWAWKQIQKQEMISWGDSYLNSGVKIMLFIHLFTCWRKKMTRHPSSSIKYHAEHGRTEYVSSLWESS